MAHDRRHSMLVHSWQGWAGQAWARRGRGRGRGRERARAGRSGDGDLLGPLRRFVPLGQTRRKSAAGRLIGSVGGLYRALWGRELPSGRGTTIKMPICVDMRALVDEPNGQRTTFDKTKWWWWHTNCAPAASQQVSQSVRPGVDHSRSSRMYIDTVDREQPQFVRRLRLHGHTHTRALDPFCFTKSSQAEAAGGQVVQVPEQQI
ncbi:hypothetical protein F4859DRAFT_123254 [Xylaria cf. heliscus]|nr:hypothetical protein F4859DRAFT_123254 [Xylaria cf. heliscus]